MVRIAGDRRPSTPTVLFATNPYLEPLLEGALEVARECGWDFLFDMRRTGRFPARVKPDAIIATAAEPWMIERLAKYTCPIVLMLCTSETGLSPYPSVVPDYEKLGETGARHLLELGRPHLAFYRRFAAPDSTAIRTGFERVLHARGREFHQIDFPSEFPGMTDAGPGLRIPREEWHTRLGARLQQLPKPCAIMAEDDRFGTELIRIALQQGLRVPEDVAVLGCDDVYPENRISPVPLSSVDANLQGVGFLAARLVQDLLEGKPAPKHPLVAPPRGVVPRRSTAMFTCEDERIAAVVCRIRSQYREPLSVTDLAKDAGICVRSLQAGFKAVLGSGVREEIIRCRMECAERLLEETELKISAVAAESGIGDPKSLSRFFQLKHGITPLAFRNRVRASHRCYDPALAGA